MSAPRYADRFTSLDGSTTIYTFPTARYEYESSQPLRSPAGLVLGSSYGFRHLGTARALRAIGSERIRAVAIEATDAALEDEIDELRSELYTVGLGKLWTIDADAARRWCYAELAEMPTYTLNPETKFALPVTFGFNRYSDWFAETSITHTETVTASPDTFTVSNPGNMNATIVEVRFRNTSGTPTGLKLENLTSVNTPFGAVLYTFETLRDLTGADHEVRLFTGSPAEAASVKRSTDNGSAYADDFAQIVIPTAHRLLAFALAPGDNSLKATIPSVGSTDVQITAYAPFA